MVRVVLIIIPYQGVRMKRNRLLLTLTMMLLSEFSRATVIGYWRFDDDAPGNTASLVSSSVNSPALNGAASGNASGLPPVFDADLPGAGITDGAGGPFLHLNTASLQFNNVSVPGDLNSQNGGKITVSDPGDGTLHPASFTAEAFVRLDVQLNYPNIISKNRADAGGSTWMMDMTNDGRLRARFDSQTLGLGSGNSGFNQSFNGGAINDGLWHHVGLTYDGATRVARLFIDYTDVGGGVVTNPLVYDNNPLTIGQGGGGRAFDGWIDEVRISDNVLSADQFLHVVPEPSSLALMALGSWVIIRFRRSAA